MLALVHQRHGDPAYVLQWADIDPPPPPPSGHVAVRVTYAAIHPGDLLAIQGSPAFGAPPAIAPGGRIPGLEGVGVIEAIGPGVAPHWGLSVGMRVAYFPVANGWSARINAPAASLVPVPDDLTEEVAARILINTISAAMILRAVHEIVPADQRAGATVLQTGASSAVGRIVTVLLGESGVSAIRLVRSTKSAQALTPAGYAAPVIATQTAYWKEQLRETVGDREIQVAIDGVGGKVLPEIAEALAVGGTIINYGTLGGSCTDIRLLAPRALTLKGLTLGHWGLEPEAVRAKDVATALRLARDNPELFPVAATYTPLDVASALEHVRRPGRNGAVLLTFQGP